MTFSPKRAMAEVRYSSLLGSWSSSSPMKHNGESSPLISESHLDDDDDGLYSGRDHDRGLWSYLYTLRPSHFSDDNRFSPHSSGISGFLLSAIVLAALISIFSIMSRLNDPYLCKIDGIALHCPRVKESASLWKNPYSATTSWKPCVEHRHSGISDLPRENETNGYIFIHAEGGLNQQRIAICNAVAVAKILNATLILPDDVQIVQDIPEWFTDKSELFSSIRWTVKNIPKYAPAQFYIVNVLPRLKEKKIMALKPFVDRLGYDNVPQEINRLRCRVNYHALKFLPYIEQMADLLTSRVRNRTGIPNPYMALHLRFEKGMVGLSFCDFVGTREEKVKNGSHLWQLALQKRKEGRCPLEPGEVAVIMRAMGYSKETQIYVASGQVYGSQNRMAPLRNMFPNLVTKEELETQDELDGFKKACDKLGSPRFLSVLEVRCVCDDSWRQLCKTDHWCSEIHGTLA
ncbi:hypothetical protein SAY87_016880 [Trapa incisa]|uniref:O-fucosyltransferase family protein n=1 Tax=Trapa incisa TaxID=236973 RepID=A0AAN7LA25_9MYRT|nr:hypothetical protein SAY87_016880 [Trapa incisa]